jgi:PPR repeat family/Pentatricopeptide repeat domain
MLRHARCPKINLLEFLCPHPPSRRRPGSLALNFTACRRLARHASAPSLPNASETATFERIRRQITLLDRAGGTSLPNAEVKIFNKNLCSLKQALRDHNLSAISEHWSQLRDPSFHRLITPPLLEDFSESIVRLWSTRVLDDTRDERARRAVEEIASVAATGHSANALNAILLTYLKRKDPTTVLDLYARYLDFLGGEVSGGEEPTGDEEPTGGVDVNYDALAFKQPSEYNTDVGAVNIVLAVITAHAMTDSFGDALQAFLATNLRLPQYTVGNYLKGLDHDPQLRQRVEDYTRSLGIARLVIRSPSLVKHITNMSSTQNVERLEDFYLAVINGLSGSNAFLTTDPNCADPGKVVITEIAWISFLSAFLKCQRVDLAERMWDDLLRLGIPTGVSLWTALIDGYDGMGAVNEAVVAWTAMTSQGIEPDAMAYRALIATLFNAKHPDKAWGQFRYFEEKLQKGLISSANQPVVTVYNTTLHGLLLNLRIPEAIALFQKMKTKGPKPDLVSYNTFLRFYAKRGDFKAIAAHVRDMTTDGVAGDVFTFSTILSALLKIGNPNAPDMMLNLMAKQNINPNVAIFTSIIDQQMREKNPKNFEAALQLLRKMEQNPDMPPNEVTYTTILSGLYRGTWLEPHIAEEYRVNMMQRMKKRGIRPNAVTYQILIRGSLYYPEPEGLQNALKYYREMVDQKIYMSQKGWFTLLLGLTQRGEWGIAKEMVMDMQRSGVHPIGGLGNLAQKILRADGQEGKKK